MPARFYDDDYTEKDFKKDFGELGVKVLDRLNGDMESAANIIVDNFEGVYCGVWDFLQEQIKLDDDYLHYPYGKYIDWDSVYNDYFLSKDYIFFEIDYKTYIFKNNNRR